MVSTGVADRPGSVHARGGIGAKLGLMLGSGQAPGAPRPRSARPVSMFVGSNNSGSGTIYTGAESPKRAQTTADAEGSPGPVINVTSNGPGGTGFGPTGEEQAGPAGADAADDPFGALPTTRLNSKAQMDRRSASMSRKRRPPSRRNSTAARMSTVLDIGEKTMPIAEERNEVDEVGQQPAGKEGDEGAAADNGESKAGDEGAKLSGDSAAVGSAGAAASDENHGVEAPGSGSSGEDEGHPDVNGAEDDAVKGGGDASIEPEKKKKKKSWFG